MKKTLHPNEALRVWGNTEQTLNVQMRESRGTAHRERVMGENHVTVTSTPMLVYGYDAAAVEQYVESARFMGEVYSILDATEPENTQDALGALCDAYGIQMVWHAEDIEPELPRRQRPHLRAPKEAA